jgi:hypothetical protein
MSPKRAVVPFTLGAGFLAEQVTRSATGPDDVVLQPVHGHDVDIHSEAADYHAPRCR